MRKKLEKINDLNTNVDIPNEISMWFQSNFSINLVLNFKSYIFSAYQIILSAYRNT